MFLTQVSHFTQHFVDQLDMEVCAVELLQREERGLKVEECRRMLGQFGVGGAPAVQQIATLSGGQKVRVALALLASSRPNCLLLDEPTNHLDMDTVQALADALRHFKGGVVIVSHEEALLEEVPWIRFLHCAGVWGDVGVQGWQGAGGGGRGPGLQEGCRNIHVNLFDFPSYI